MALTTPIETIDSRPTCCEYVSGRMFYGHQNSVYFSQVMRGVGTDEINRCYQQNDPTSEIISDLLDTDGGVVQIDNASRIIQIKKFNTGVLIYAANGLWYLAGPVGGFKATDFSLTQVTETGCQSPQSVVAVEGAHFFWSPEGIFHVMINQFGRAEAKNIIEENIQTFYNDIPLISKQKVTGIYNRVKKQVEWHYPSAAQTGATDYKYACDKSLVLDIRSGGMWPQTYNTTKTEADGQFIASAVNTMLGTEDEDVQQIVVVVDNLAATQDYSIDFGTKDDGDFQDWGSNYPTAYVETGYETLNKPSNKKVAPYINTHFVQTEDAWVSDGAGGLMLDNQSGCQLQAKWDWNTSSANNRWSAQQQAYRFRRNFMAPDIAGSFDSGESVIVTKNKMLGRGGALSLRFEQEAQKDMKILGYTVQYNIKGKM